MKSFLSSLRKLDSPSEMLHDHTDSAEQVQLFASLVKTSRTTDKSMKKGIAGISLSLYTCLLTIGTSVGFGIIFNPQRSLANSSACVGVFSTNAGGTVGFLNTINNSYTNILNYSSSSTNINGAAVQPSTGNVYFVDRANGKLVYYNTTTNAATVLTITGTGLPAISTLVGATFKSTGELYLFYGTSQKIAQIDPATGSLIDNVLNITGLPGAVNGDIAIDPSGQLYLIGDPASTPKLYKLTVGSTLASVDTGVAITGLSGAANGLAIDPINGNFFVSTASGTYRLNTSVSPHTVAASSTNLATDLAACGAPIPNKPTIVKQFSPGTVIGLPATSTLTLSLGNDNLVPIYLTQALTDNLPSGLLVATPNGLSTTCKDALSSSTTPVTAATGTSSIVLSNGAKIPVGGCTISVNVKANSPGTYTNTIAAGDLKTITGNNENATISTFLVPNVDYSDAPTSGTAPDGTGTNAYGDAIHVVVSTLKLGTAIDSDAGSLASANADGDGADDDGITLPTLTAGATSYSIPAANITATNTSGAAATLHAWVDFNKNGTFEANEYASTTVSTGTNGGNPTAGLSWSGITVGAAGNTFARFRLTTDSSVTSTTPSGAATNGEVEDYKVTIQAAPLACGIIYGSYNGGIFNSLRAYNPSTGSVGTQIATLSTGATNVAVAAIAVDPLLDNNSNRRVYYMDNTGTNARLFYYDGTTNVNTGITLTVSYSPAPIVQSDGTVGSLINSFNRMGFAPDGTLYIADAQKTLYRFSPDRLSTGGTLSSAVTIVDNPNNDSNNSGRARVDQSGGGDIAFDNAGRMYIVTYDSNNGSAPTEFRLFQIFNPNSASPTAILLGRNPSTDTVAGLAFQASDNKLYLQGSGGKSFSWDLATNTVGILTTVSPGSADLGSCTYPNLNPTGAFTKAVANITTPSATVPNANDVLEYTLSVINNGNLVAGNVTLIDAIPAGTTYVTGSTKLNGTAQPDNAGAMPYANTVTPKQVNSPGQASGVLTAGASNKATVVFRVTVNAASTQVCNQGNVKYDGSLPAGLFSDDPSTTTIADDQTCTSPVSSNPNVLLVKRITAVNGNTTNGSVALNTYDPDPTYPYDKNVIQPGLTPPSSTNWPGTTGAATSTFLLGARDGGTTKINDEVEYTIYFLSTGTGTAKNVTICDRIPRYQTFVPDAFNSLTAAPNTTPASPGGDRGIQVSQGITTYGYTNIGDGDTARYYPPQSTLPAACTQSALAEDNGTIVVNLGDVPNATLPGDPVESYGFIRFRARVK